MAVFETELMGIAGVKAEPVKPAVSTPTAQATPTPSITDDNVNANDEEAAPENVDRPTSTSTSPAAQQETQAAKPAEPATQSTGSAVAQGNPMDGEDGNGECNLLGDFALFVQGALGLLAVSSLAIKRLRESPRRPMKIWFFDVSKQVFGSVLLHLANVLMSMLSSGKFDVAATTAATPQYAVTDEQGKQPNPCSFYLLNLAIDVRSFFQLQERNIQLTIHRPQSVFPSLSSSLKSSTQPLPAPPLPTLPNQSGQETTASHPVQPGGSSNPSSTSSASLA